MMALEDVLIRRIWSAEVDRRQRFLKLPPQRQKGEIVNGDLAFQLTILAKVRSTSRRSHAFTRGSFEAVQTLRRNVGR